MKRNHRCADSGTNLGVFTVKGGVSINANLRDNAVMYAALCVEEAKK